MLVGRFKEGAKSPFRALWRFEGCGNRVFPDLGSHESYKRGKGGLLGLFSLFLVLVYAV